MFSENEGPPDPPPIADFGFFRAKSSEVADSGILAKKPADRRAFFFFLVISFLVLPFFLAARFTSRDF
jgi:hypothetical protein